MKMHEFVRITAALQSFADSTYLRMASGGLVCEVTGRCSPYISHRKVEYGENSITFPAALVANDKYSLVISPFIDPLGGEDLVRVLGDYGANKVISTAVPRRMVDDLIVDLRRYLRWGLNDPSVNLVQVAIGVPRVVGWDEEHKPIFAKPAPPEMPEQEDEPKSGYELMAEYISPQACRFCGDPAEPGSTTCEVCDPAFPVEFSEDAPPAAIMPPLPALA